MTPEKQIAAIAAACPGLAHMNAEGSWVWRKYPWKSFDPLNDLNAMHEAVNSLDESGRLEWLAWMDKLTVDPADKKDQAWFPARFLNAKCQTWSEAFLRTIGKWEEGE